MQYKAKMLISHLEKMQSCLITNKAVEQGCFLLCAVARYLDSINFLVKEVIPLSDADLASQDYNCLSVQPATMLRIARQAQQTGLSICFVHTHPMTSGPVSFSSADDIGNMRSFDFFHRMVSLIPHTCLVFNGDLSHVSGRVYLTGEKWVQMNKVEVIGFPDLQTCPITDESLLIGSQIGKFDRQAKILGKQGQLLIKQLRVAIVGVGGIGALVATMLAHTGVGELILIDPDIVEESNLPRLLGVPAIAAMHRDFKVNALEQYYIKTMVPDCLVSVRTCDCTDSIVRDDLIAVDAIVCATDNTRSRAYLNQLSQQYYIPFLDLGVEFSAHTDGHLVNEIGKVNFVLPGTPCLFCTNHLDPERLRLESLAEDNRQQLLKDGYIRGANIDQPAMMMFNMEVAARGTQILIAQLTGLKSTDMEFYEKFAFLNLNERNHWKKVHKRKNPDCLFCNSTGLYLGAGDALKPLIKPITLHSEECT